jgi:carboxypeptidase T
MTVPRSGYFVWHVNPSLRPSQYATAHLDEAWTLTCGRGWRKETERIEVARGAVARADLKRCKR